MRSALPVLAAALIAGATTLAGAATPAFAGDRADDTALAAATRDLRRALSGGEGQAWWEIGGRVAFDLVERDDDHARRSGGHTDGARLDLRFGRGPWHGLVEVDLEGSDTPSNLREAWIGYALGPRLVLHLGQVRQAMNSETATPAAVRGVPGLGFASHLTGRTAPGIAAESEWNCGGIRWEVSATAGHGFGVEGAQRRSDRLLGRGVFRPLQNLLPAGIAREMGDGLWAGLAIARDRQIDEALRVETPLESTIFRTRDLRADAATTWLAECGWAWDRFRVSGERTVGDLHGVETRGGDLVVDRVTGWAVHAAVSLSGPELGFEHGRWTRGRPVAKPVVGDWELAARFAETDIDGALVRAGLAPAGRAAAETRTLTAALGWRPSPEIRVLLAWEHTSADAPVTAFGGERSDDALLLRVELAF